MKSYIPAPPRLNANAALIILVGLLMIVGGTALTFTVVLTGGPAWLTTVATATAFGGGGLVFGAVLTERGAGQARRHTHRRSPVKTFYRLRRTLGRKGGASW